MLLLKHKNAQPRTSIDTDPLIQALCQSRHGVWGLTHHHANTTVFCFGYEDNPIKNVTCSLAVTCREWADLLALLYVMFYCVFVTFPCGVLGHVWCLIVSIPDLCLLSYFALCTDNLLTRYMKSLNLPSMPLWMFTCDIFEAIYNFSSCC